MLDPLGTICSINNCQMKPMTMAEDEDGMWCILLQSCLNSTFLSLKRCTLKHCSTIQAQANKLAALSIQSCRKERISIAFLQRENSHKMFQQVIHFPPHDKKSESSSTVAISVPSSAIIQEADLLATHQPIFRDCLHKISDST